jgi:hypothetical protein
MSKQSDLVSVSQGAGGDPLFIDTANNRVGVGTASPAQLLQLNGSSPFLNIRDGANSNPRGIEFDYNGSLISGSLINYGATGETALSGGESGTTGYFLTFKTDGSERARIDASGNLLVGKTVTTFTTNGLWNQPQGTYWASRTSDVSLVLNRNGTDGDVAQFYKGGTIVGAIAVTASSTAYYTSSDYRLKENVVPLAGAADRLMQIPVCRFNFTADPDRTVDGFLAHEVQAFVPECVTGEKDQVETVEVTDEDGNVTTETRPVYQGIDQSKLVPLLTAALQEALQKIDALETRISALETN